MRENILIVYYSYSGKTRMKQVREENRSGKLPALLPVTESVGGYDIVFAGSPKMEYSL